MRRAAGSIVYVPQSGHVFFTSLPATETRKSPVVIGYRGRERSYRVSSWIGRQLVYAGRKISWMPL